MLEIPINDQRYHINDLTNKEKNWGITTYKKVVSRYDGLSEFISATLSPLHLDKNGANSLLGTVTLAFCHAMKAACPPKNEAELYKALKAWYHSFLPYIVQNLKHEHPSHPVQFEPVALSCLYASRVTLRAIEGVNFKDRDLDFELAYTLEYCALFRAIHSSILLLLSGDDVHGVSLLRGVLEIFSKLILAKSFPKEYTLFKTYNLYLQAKKHVGEPLPEDMQEYLKDEPLYRKNPESFLAYGWARNNSNKRIGGLSELVNHAIKNQDIKGLFQLASEFIHEDYVGIGYDYISIRKGLLDYYYYLFQEISSEDIIVPGLSQKEGAGIRHLLNLAKSAYSGDFPLSFS